MTSTVTGTVAAAGAFRSAAALFWLLATPVVAANELIVKAAPCASRIEVRADGVPLDEVLRAVTKALGVRLEAKTELREPVRFSAVDTPERVLTRLMQGRNLVLDSNAMAKCGGREVLTTVWVLPAGASSTPRSASVAPQAAPALEQQPGEAQFRALRPPRPRGLRKRMSDEEAKQVVEDWKAGKVQADPQTGLPVPVEPRTEP